MRGPGCLCRRLCYDVLAVKLSYEADNSPFVAPFFCVDEFDLFFKLFGRAFVGFFRIGAFERV